MLAMQRQAKGCFDQSTIKNPASPNDAGFFMLEYDLETIRPRNVASAVWGPVAK